MQNKILRVLTWAIQACGVYICGWGLANAFILAGGGDPLEWDWFTRLF